MGVEGEGVVSIQESESGERLYMFGSRIPSEPTDSETATSSQNMLTVWLFPKRRKHDICDHVAPRWF